MSSLSFEPMILVSERQNEVEAPESAAAIICEITVIVSRAK
jgi:hypothetical protein